MDLGRGRVWQRLPPQGSGEALSKAQGPPVLVLGCHLSNVVKVRSCIGSLPHSCITGVQPYLTMISLVPTWLSEAQGFASPHKSPFICPIFMLMYLSPSVLPYHSPELGWPFYDPRMTKGPSGIFTVPQHMCAAFLLVHGPRGKGFWRACEVCTCVRAQWGTGLGPRNQ